MSSKVLLQIALCFLASDGLRLHRNGDMGKASSSGNKLTILHNKTQHAMQNHHADVRETSYRKQKEVEEENHVYILCGMSFFLVVMVGCVAIGVTAPAPPRTQRPIQTLQSSNISLNLYRKSGDHLTSLSAETTWGASELEGEVTVHLPPNEHVHSILYETDAREQRITDFSCIGGIGIKDGAKLKVIVLPSCTLPSGVVLYSYTKRIAGPIGAREVAKLWLHEDKSTNLEYGKILDVDRVELAYVNGTLDDEGRLHLQNDVHTVEAIIPGVTRTLNLNLPDFGDVELKQEIPDAVFDLRQKSDFLGWISLFKCSELVAKFAKRTSEGTSSDVTHLRFKVSTDFLPDGLDDSIKLRCAKHHSFSTWDEAGTISLSWSATLKGPVGCRKLVLVDFPIIGNLELIEHPFCSAMTQR